MKSVEQIVFNRWFIVAVCILPFLGFWTYGLTDLDEGFYGAVVTDMLRRGDWITPTYNGAPWFEKPILAYWLAMPTVAIFPNEFGARLPSVLCTLLTLVVAFRFLREHVGREVAAIAVVGYVAALLPAGLGRMMMTDAPLALCLAIAFTQFYKSLGGPLKHRWFAAAAVGFGVLAKGPVAIILFFGVVGVLFWICRELRPKFKGGWLIGTLLCLAVIATWYVPCYLANGQGFIDKFLIEQNIGRFAGGDKAHTVPFYLHPIYFPLIVLVGSGPFLWYSFRAKTWSYKARQFENWEKLLLAWAAVPVVFFTISGTKLPHYILPAILPIVALAATRVVSNHPMQLKPSGWMLIAAGWAATIFGLANPILHQIWDKQTYEVQALAKFAWEKKKPLVIYQIGRSGGGPEIKLQLDQTSHPSILFYYRQPALMTDQIADVIKRGEPTWVLMRSGRLGDSDLADLTIANWEIKPIVKPVAQEDYALVEMTPSQVAAR